MNTILRITINLAATAAIALAPAAHGQLQDSKYTSYELKHVQPDEVRRMLIDLLGNDSADVQVFADTEQKQLVVSGPARVQKLAAQLVQQIDQPAAKSSPAIEKPILKTYQVPTSQIDRRLDGIREIAGRDARITVDRNRGQVIVVASAASHERLKLAMQKSLRAVPKKSSSRHAAIPIEVADPDSLFPRRPITNVARRTGATDYRLRGITATQCEQALNRLLGKKLWDLGEGRFRYTAGDAGQVNIELDRDNHVCRMKGEQELVDQLVSLLDWFEKSQNRDSDEAYRFVPLNNIRPDVLDRAIRLWKQSSERARPLNGLKSSGRVRKGTAIQPVGFFQDETAPGPENLPLQVTPESENDGELRRPSSDVNVQPLPGLDVLILRGRDPDVDELVRIIQEIERLSDETAPEIEVVFLKSAKGETLNQIVRSVLEELTGPLQGRISITPLVRPNALLLIGWGEAVTAAKKLIQTLDQPVDPASEMQVIALQHAPVSEVQATILQFLNGRGGMASDVNVSSNTRTNSLVVNASPQDMAEVAALVKTLDVASSASVNKAKMVRLKNSLAADVSRTITTALAAARGGGGGRRSAALEMLLVQPDGKEVIASGLLDNVTLTPDVRTNSIFITGPEQSLGLVERLIQELDESPAASAQIKVFQITNSHAGELVTVLRSLFPEGSTSSVPQLPTVEDETSLVPVRFSVDVRTNTIIATGAAGDLKIVEALLLRLDQTESQERINQVYRLKNSPATAVADAVNDFLRSERVVNQAAPGRQNPFQQIEQEVVVVPEPIRNSLIISATERYYEQIVELVEHLDEQPPQVMIQVVLAEVDLNNFHEFGMEVGLQDSLLFDRSLLGDLLTTSATTTNTTPGGAVTSTVQDTVQGASNSPGFNFNNNPLGNSGSDKSLASAGNVAGQALSHFSLGRLNSDLDYGGLVLSASSENVSVLLRALDESGTMEILSRPQIMTLDNQQAFIQVGQRVPRIVSSQLTQLGQINTLALEDVGLLLGVTPRISPEGQVVMEIDAEKSEVGAEREGIPISVSAEGAVIRSPRVNVTTAQTTVSAASGQTIVIGGLITNANTTLSRKVPWLGDLPVLGNLFRYDSHNNMRKELLIILTPHVIIGKGDAEYRKQVEMSRMSWVTGDVFDLIGSDSSTCGMMDENGVPVIYPDQSAHQNLPMETYEAPAPVPAEGVPSQPVPDSLNTPPAPGDTGSLSIPETKTGVTNVSFAEAASKKKTSGVVSATINDKDKPVLKKTAKAKATRKKWRWFGESK